MRAAYGHYEALTFSDYTDLETGKTLHAEPGGVYDIAPASGHVVPELPEPWFTAAEPLAPAVVSATAGMTGETDFAAGPTEDFSPGLEPETPEG